jgi:hypothetical protein
LFQQVTPHPEEARPAQEEGRAVSKDGRKRDIAALANTLAMP